MKMFVWERVNNATSNWHPEGGVMVVAEMKKSYEDEYNEMYGEDEEDDEEE